MEVPGRCTLAPGGRLADLARRRLPLLHLRRIDGLSQGRLPLELGRRILLWLGAQAPAGPHHHRSQTLRPGRGRRFS